MKKHSIKKQLIKWKKSLHKKDQPDEYEAKNLISQYGIQVPESIRILPEQPFKAPSILSPFVLKVCTPDIFHKTDQQGVILNNNRENVTRNFKQLRKRFPNAPILVENQRTFLGPEFIIGVIQDPVFGPTIMVGAGGILTEIYKDSAFRLIPCSVNEAIQMIEELTLSPVFDNFRGMELDKHKLATTIFQISQLVIDMQDDLTLLDINPIVYCDTEWVALDVKMQLSVHLPEQPDRHHP